MKKRKELDMAVYDHERTPDNNPWFWLFWGAMAGIAALGGGWLIVAVSLWGF